MGEGEGMGAAGKKKGECGGLQVALPDITWTGREQEYLVSKYEYLVSKYSYYISKTIKKLPNFLFLPDINGRGASRSLLANVLSYLPYSK